ncbi:MAG TPA: hypothetical protein VKJ65_07275, partial [Phycisphaerae bacterium]|nr:hypothetical protein [Phycisphaerae bacterium]
ELRLFRRHGYSAKTVVRGISISSSSIYPAQAWVNRFINLSVQMGQVNSASNRRGALTIVIIRCCVRFSPSDFSAFWAVQKDESTDCCIPIQRPYNNGFAERQTKAGLTFGDQNTD